MKDLIRLYITFAKMGAMTFGGGYAMLPIIQRDIVEKLGWATEEEVADYYAIGQCTPGIIAVNTSTFIGYKKCGIAGGILATLGFATPSLIIISLIAATLTGFADIPLVQNALAGIRVCVCVLLLNAILTLWKKSVTDVISFVIFALIAALSLLTPLPPAIMVLTAGISGIIVNVLKKRHAVDNFAEAKSDEDKAGMSADDPAYSENTIGGEDK